MKKYLVTILLCQWLCITAIAQTVCYTSGDLRFDWELPADKASLTVLSTGAVNWRGSLLPSFWIKNAKGQLQYVKARALTGNKGGVALAFDSLGTGKQGSIALLLDSLGTGKMEIEQTSWGIRVRSFEVTWHHPAPAIVEMYIGASLPPVTAVNVKPVWDRPFLPDWQSLGYCLPGAKGGTVQSYFRMWDFGQSDIALGNFGPSMSSPYGAAFPRPVLFTAMGEGKGWISIGVGDIPDGAMSLSMRAARGCFRYLYREDLWGASPTATRSWNDLLRITIDTTAYAAFGKYYSSFPVNPEKKTVAPVSIWNTWGMWRKRKYPIRPIADFTRSVQSEMMVLDDPWETSQGSGEPDLQRFPDFFADVAYIRSKGLSVGVWETIGWIKDTAAAGLTRADLIRDTHGEPCLGNWNFDPTGDAWYCLDVSSPRARAFIQTRTRKTMQQLQPGLIKLDFGYGLPNPNMGVPVNPLYRGERYSFELVRLITEAAKSVNPNVVMLYYGISPLWAPVMDMVSLDDQGDLWYDTRQGHQEWSIWASLLSKQGVALSGSSSYDWLTDDEVLMNTVILGTPGAVLPSELDNGTPVPLQYLHRRWAVNKWYRRTVLWEPCWLNSYTGGVDGPPQLRCWGRMENKQLTALTLRESSNKELKGTPAANIRWTGNWSLISQDGKAITATDTLAVIPFSAGRLTLPYAKQPLKVTAQGMGGHVSAGSWSWKNGWLTITVTSAELAQLGSFLVTMK